MKSGTSPKPWFTHAANIALLLGVVGFCYGQLGFGNVSTVDFPLQPWWGYLFLLTGLLFLVARSVARKRFVTVLSLPSVFLVLVLTLVLCSDAVIRRQGFYVGNDARWFVLILGLPVVALAYIRWRFERVANGLQQFFSLPLLLFFQIAIAILFIDLADGRIIFSDDHPSFWYRLLLLQRQFPQVPFYSTDWEAGYSAREFFASGLLNFYFITLPFWYSGVDLTNIASAVIYNYALLFVFVGVIPLSVYASVRLLRHSPMAATLAGLLALGPTLGYFEWLLKYGTLGFCCAVGFLPLAFSFLYRLAIAEDPPRKRDALGLLLSSFLCISWSPGVFAFVPVAILGLYRWRSTFAAQRRIPLAIFLIGFVCINAPWVKIFVEESKVFSFMSGSSLPGVGTTTEATVKKEPPHKTVAQRLNRLHSESRELFAKVNPVILVLFLPGLILLPCTQRRVWLATMLWLLGLAFFGEEIKPQLEFRRMIIPAMFLACLPVALAVEKMIAELYAAFQQSHRRVGIAETGFWNACLVLLVGMVLLSPVTVAAVYQNRSDEQFRFAPENLGAFSQAINLYGGKGRVFFFGFILQELGASDYKSQDGGHIAILAALTGKPLYAHYYYHSRWETIDPVPRSYRARGETGIEEFLDLLNVTSVITFKKEWVQYCAKNPRYREVAQFDRFRIFTRTSEVNGFFLEGDGEVRELRDGIEVTAHSTTATLRYRYLPKLRPSTPQTVTISPVKVFDEDTGANSSKPVEFIQLQIAPEQLGKPFRLSYW